MSNLREIRPNKSEGNESKNGPLTLMQEEINLKDEWGHIIAVPNGQTRSKETQERIDWIEARLLALPGLIAAAWQAYPEVQKAKDKKTSDDDHLPLAA